MLGVYSTGNKSALVAAGESAAAGIGDEGLMTVRVRERDWRMESGGAAVTLAPGAQMRFHLPVCSGRTGYVPVADGVAQTWFNGVGKEAFTMEAGTGEPELLCMLPQGERFQLDSPANKLHTELRGGSALLMLVASSRGVFSNPAGQRLQNTTCHFSARGLEQGLADVFDAPFELAAACRRMAVGKAFDPVTLELRGCRRFPVIGRELMVHPFTGHAAQLYLESRLLEVAALIVDALQTRNGEPRAHALRRAEIERIHEARERLDFNLEEPPSLEALARAVGLGRNRLVDGFRQQYGMTPFEWLRTARLDYAKATLEAGRASVTDVALASGYRHPSSFSAAFKKRFGVAPQAVGRTGEAVA